ncbi:MAG TPA: ribonuclease HII, partial [Spirochaetota bacterium]|nr:ribonuclease HII [Spirochaetota bacterium]
MPDFDIEKGLLLNGCKYVAGIDEAGRGSLAGPLSVSMV